MMEKLLKSNTIVKIVAFFLAAILWAFVTGDLATHSQPPEISRSYTDVALEWKNLDEQLEIMQMPEKIDVVLRGQSDVLDDITPQMLRIYVDLKGLGTGQHRLTPLADVPRGVKVMSYDPKQVAVELEEVLSPQMSVDVDIMGLAADGFVVDEPRVIPNTVFVRGARSNLDNVKRVRALINIEDANTNRTQMVPVHAVDAVGQLVDGIEVSPNLVEVFIPISLPQKEVPVHLSTSGEPAEGFEIDQIILHPARVLLEGTKAALENILEVPTITIDITDADDDIITTATLGDVPEGIEVLYDGQIQVEVIITEIETTPES